VSSTPSERFVRSFGLEGCGTVTLTTAGTATGETIAGSIDLSGYSYDAEVDP